MSYTAAKTNWVVTDYMNVADFTRIYENTRLTSSLFSALHSEVVFNTLATPTTSSIPRQGGIDPNVLLANIERLRVAAVAVPIPGVSVEIKDDWNYSTVPTFTYSDANLWESTIDTIWEYDGGPDLVEDRVLSADITILTGTNLIIINSLDLNGYSVDIQGTGALHII